MLNKEQKKKYVIVGKHWKFFLKEPISLKNFKMLFLMKAIDCFGNSFILNYYFNGFQLTNYALITNLFVIFGYKER